MASIFLTICWLVFPLGQLAKIDIFGLNIPVFDILLILLALFSLKKNKYSKSLIIFGSIAVVTSIINIRYPVSFQANFYLLRLATLLLLSTSSINQNSMLPAYIAYFSFLFWGFIQYFLWPNNTLLSQIGWDPHTNRLLGTLMDPTFTGLALVLFLFWQLFQQKPKKWLLLLNYIAIALTYSRSSLLSLFIPLTYFLLSKKKFTYVFGLCCLLVTTIFLLPKPPGESTNLSRSNSIFAKVENYKEGISLFAKSPFWGTGYNNLGFFRKDQGHASWGFDSSLLNIACTTGIAGLLSFVCYVFSLYSKFNKYQKIILLASIIHSFFSNSLLNPWIIFLVLFLPFSKTTARKL